MPPTKQGPCSDNAREGSMQRLKPRRYGQPARLKNRSKTSERGPGQARTVAKGQGGTGEIPLFPSGEIGVQSR